MSKAKIRYQNETKKVKELFDLRDIQSDVDMDEIENILQQDANIFLLNNLMMSVQFFENYERDVKHLRENWFKEFSLESHNKKCFYADSLFRLSAARVKFSPRRGGNENPDTTLHPLRTYITSDNMEAAFDPSALGRNVLKVWPEYQFTVKTSEKDEKSRFVSLVEFKTIKEPNSSTRGKSLRNSLAFDSNEDTEQIYFHNINVDEYSGGRRLTKTEMSIAFLNDNNLKRAREKCSAIYSYTSDESIPANGFYRYENSEYRLKPKAIFDLKMNSAPVTSHEIPRLCFQYEEIKNNPKARSELYGCFRTQRVLNSVAFKGYFCDLLIEKLSGALDLDPEALNRSMIVEEFIIVNQNGVEHCIAPVIPIRDWNNFVEVKRFRNAEGLEELMWPSKYMEKIVEILPCNAVPTSHSGLSTDDLDYEKMWKLVFPKTEEFLLLHMMHAHVRCYFFVLLLYKSSIEPEINSASLGPNHLMHLLFWKVHKNFLAWPDDRPAETFLTYLKTLYKKLQNKRLPDFFITSRNLFATSHPKDLHMAQALIKKIIENPIPYIIRAISHLKFHPDFYPSFDCLRLHTVLTNTCAPLRINRAIKKEKIQKRVQFQIDEEQLWKKKAIKQIEMEKKAKEEEQASRPPVDPINVDENLNFDAEDLEKCNQILEMFTSHFLQMGNKSIEQDFLTQGLMYLNQSQKLFQLMAARGVEMEKLKETREKIGLLKQSCYSKVKQELRKYPSKQKKQFPASSENLEKVSQNVTVEEERENEITQELHQEDEESDLMHDENPDIIVSSKL